MSKITFRADDDLVDRVEALDASKSEVMRNALRAYLDNDHTEATDSSLEGGATLDQLLAMRVEELVDDHLATQRAAERDVNVNLNFDPRGNTTKQATGHEVPRHLEDRGDEELTCTQCGEEIEESHEYCPNCGAKANGPAVCECGIELSPDWAYCPACGRPAAQAAKLSE